jgi:hypothetical protein
MNWIDALPAIVAAIAVIGVPGTIVALAFGVRGVTFAGLVPLAGVSVIGIATVANHIIAFDWGILPVAATTIVLAGAVLGLRLGLRRWWRPALHVEGGWYGWASGAAVTIAAVLLAWRLTTIFGEPGNISQTFDNVYHLNAVRYIMDIGDASPFRAGSLTYVYDQIASYYPDTWHAIAALVAQLSGGDIPVAVNALNVVIGAAVWPLGVLLLTRLIFGPRPVGALLTGVLAPAFAAFPYLMVEFGVLYPNLLSIALLPGVLALIVAAAGLGTRVASNSLVLWMLVLAAVPGLALAHPSSLIALIGFSAPIAVTALFLTLRRMRAAGSPALHLVGVIVLALAAFGAAAVVFLVARPAQEIAFWGPWMDVLPALSGPFTSGVMGMPVDWILCVLTIAGLVAPFVTRRNRWLVASWAVAAFLYFVAAAVPHGIIVRYLFVGTWYNDAYRLTALLPVLALPVAVGGAIWLWDLAVAGIRRLGRDRDGDPRPARDRESGKVVPVVGVVLLAVIAFGTQFGEHLTTRTTLAQSLYRMDDDSPLLSTDEAALLERVDETVPEGDVVAGNPATGASLVYAFADRPALLPAIFGDRRGATAELMRGLRDANTDPEVCDAVREAHAWFVLDFGERGVHASDDRIAGFSDLADSGAAELVDEEGEARLYEVTACR